MSDLPQGSPAGEQFRASPHLIRALRELHQGFCRGLVVRLSAAVRTPVEVRLQHVDSLRFQAFAERLENPTCLCKVQAEGSSERLLLEINSGILFPLIDRLLGGGHEASPIARRPLTEIEQRLAAHLAGIILTELQSAWREIVKSPLTLDGIETDPQELRASWAHSERIVQLEFEVIIGDARGGLRLCLPMSLATSLCPQSNGTSERDQHLTDREGGTVKGTMSESSVVSLVAHLAESKLNASDVAGLRPGDIITTAHGVDSPLLIRIDGVTQFHARPGALEGRKAVQIEGLIDPPV